MQSIPIGIIHSLSGPMGDTESPLVDAAMLAVEMINARGGVLGRQVEPVVRDGKSDPVTFQRNAQELIGNNKVSALFGCWTSATRKAVRPVVELEDSLLWYPVQYEGLESSPNIVYTGSCLNQQIGPAVNWCLDKGLTSFLLVGSDYVFPRTANRLARSMLLQRGGRVVGEMYQPLHATDFTAVADAIVSLKPDVVLNTVNGAGNIHLFKSLENRIDPERTRVLSVSFSEIELERAGLGAKGHLACWSYFQGVESAANKAFVSAFKDTYGRDRVVSDPIVTAYTQLLLWQKAAENAGSLETGRIRQKLPGLTLETPMGTAQIQANQHLRKKAMLGKANGTGLFEIVWQSPEEIEPLPWLGVENSDIPSRDVIITALSQLPEEIDHAARLESEIAERRRAEAAKEASEEKFRSIFENAVEGIFQSTLDGRYLSLNPAQATMLGYSSPEEAMAQIGNIDHEVYEDSQERQRFIDLLLEKESVTGFETRFRRRDGRIIWINSSARLVRDAQGEIVCIEGFNVDITLQKRAEQERLRLEEELRQSQKLESIGQLAGGVAHDLNNLLSPILGYSEIMLGQVDKGSEHHRYLNQILKAADRSRILIRQLLAFGRKQILKMEVVDLNQLIAGFRGLLGRTIRENVAIEVHLDEDLHAIEADASQLEQVLLNLAVNAQDAMPEGGTLTIETANIELGREYALKRPGVEPGSYVMLAVSDTGTGIDPQHLEHIFEPFYTTKGEGRGTGLGLATVYGIVKQQNGNIWVYSEPGQGTVFKVYFPKTEAASVQPETVNEMVDDLAGTETLVVAEDNTMVLALASDVLRELGYTVFAVSGSEECFDLFTEHGDAVDLLLTDLVMPRMNGKELYTRLKKKHPRLKVVYMSGYTENLVAKNGVLEDGTYFLQKPFSIAELAIMVRKALESD